MVTRRPQGAPNELFPRIAAEHYENTPEALEMKRAIAASAARRKAVARAQLANVFADPRLTTEEKLAKKREIEAKSRVDEASDPNKAQLTAYGQEWRGKVRKDLQQAFAERPAQAFEHQEVNYHPGGVFKPGSGSGRRGDQPIGLAPSEVINNERRRQGGFTADEEARAHVALGGDVEDLPAELEQQLRSEVGAKQLQAKEATARAGAEDAFAIKQLRPGKVRKELSAFFGEMDAKSQRPAPRPAKTGPMEFYRGPLPGDSGYGMSPEEFVAPARPQTVSQNTAPSFPTVRPTGRRRPSATVLDLA